MRECVDASSFKPCGRKNKNVKKSLSVCRISHRAKSSPDSYMSRLSRLDLNKKFLLSN